MSNIQIVILQRGWVAVGEFSQDGSACELDNAKIIRRWGTDKGLGQIASGGPTSKTVLDPGGTLRFHELTVVARLECSAEAWQGRLQ